MAANKAFPWLVASALLPLLACPLPLSLSVSVHLPFSPENSFSQPYFPWAFADCVIAIIPHAGAMATGGVYSASDCKFATFDDTSRMRCLSCVCVCCTCRECQKQSYLSCQAAWAASSPEMRTVTESNTLTCQFVRISQRCVRSVNEWGFMKRVGLHSSVSSARPPWGAATPACVRLVNRWNLFWQMFDSKVSLSIERKTWMAVRLRFNLLFIFEHRPVLCWTSN